MRLNKHALKKLASLSAFGAGSVALTAMDAEAGIVYEPLDLKVGFDEANGYTDRVEVLLPGFPGLGFSFFRDEFSFGIAYGRAVGGFGFVTTALTSMGNATTLAFLDFRKTIGVFGSMIGAFPAGDKWTAPGSGILGGTVAGRVWTSAGIIQNASPASFSDRYALFRFFPQGAVGDSFFGWIHLRLFNQAGVGPDDTLGPNLRILDWAYDDQGNLIAAGDRGSTGTTPEPANLVSTGLAALVLGARGIRSWRRSRKTAA